MWGGTSCAEINMGVKGETMSQEPMTQSQNATEFERIVAELKNEYGLILRGEEAKCRAVALINKYQENFGKSRSKLEQLAKAVGVNVATLYRWKKQVEHPEKDPAANMQPSPEPNSVPIEEPASPWMVLIKKLSPLLPLEGDGEENLVPRLLGSLSQADIPVKDSAVAEHVVYLLERVSKEFADYASDIKVRVSANLAEVA